MEVDRLDLGLKLKINLVAGAFFENVMEGKGLFTASSIFRNDNDNLTAIFETIYIDLQKGLAFSPFLSFLTRAGNSIMPGMY